MYLDTYLRDERFSYFGIFIEGIGTRGRHWNPSPNPKFLGLGVGSIFQNFGICLFFPILEVFHKVIFGIDTPKISWDCVGLGSNFGIEIAFGKLWDWDWDLD